MSTALDAVVVAAPVVVDVIVNNSPTATVTLTRRPCGRPNKFTIIAIAHDADVGVEAFSAGNKKVKDQEQLLISVVSTSQPNQSALASGIPSTSCGLVCQSSGYGAETAGQRVGEK